MILCEQDIKLFGRDIKLSEQDIMSSGQDSKSSEQDIKSSEQANYLVQTRFLSERGIQLFG